ncbi:MAG TPA: hypothetical protein VGH15_11590 [Caulobacteraceae bacterium]
MRAVGLALVLLSVTIAPAAAAPATQLVVWAWERPEDLRFLPGGVEVAAQTGFVQLSGERVLARGRRFPLLMNGDPATAVVHVQIDRGRPLAWTPAQRAAAVSAVLALARPPWARRVQIDFEVRRSERRALVDLLTDVRAGLPPAVALSMTAIASWCETETWLRAVRVDEIVPMLFRMGPRGEHVKAVLAAGGDFAEPECRRALAISLDHPLPDAPAGRRVYLFSPRGWRAADFQRLRESVGTWGASGD